MLYFSWSPEGMKAQYLEVDKYLIFEVIWKNMRKIHMKKYEKILMIEEIGLA